MIFHWFCSVSCSWLCKAYTKLHNVHFTIVVFSLRFVMVVDVGTLVSKRCQIRSDLQCVHVCEREATFTLWARTRRITGQDPANPKVEHGLVEFAPKVEHGKPSSGPKSNTDSSSSHPTFQVSLNSSEGAISSGWFQLSSCPKCSGLSPLTANTAGTWFQPKVTAVWSSQPRI